MNKAIKYTLWVILLFSFNLSFCYANPQNQTDQSINNSISKQQEALNDAILDYNITYYNIKKDQITSNNLERKRAFLWQFVSTVIMFFIVMLIVLSGVYFSFLQFKVSTPPRSNKQKNRLNEHGQEKEIGETPVTTITVATTGIQISSSILGLLILFLSMFFFYIYVKDIYPLQEEASSPPQTTETTSN